MGGKQKRTKHVRRKIRCTTCLLARRSKANMRRHADANGHKLDIDKVVPAGKKA